MIVPNNGDETVSVVSTETLTEVARLPRCGRHDRRQHRLVRLACLRDQPGRRQALVIDLETMQPAGEVALPGTPETGVVTPDGTKLYVALSDANTVAVIDVEAMTVIATIDGVGEEPWGAHMAGAVNYCH